MGICRRCLPLLPWCQNVCSVCGLPVPPLQPGWAVCGRCQRVARQLIELFVYAYPHDDREELLLPVPSHPARVRERGFNAVFELIRMLGKKLSITYDLYALNRMVHTCTQTGKTAEQRRTNVKNAFQLKHAIEQRRIILFDDVVTTSATINEISRCLKSTGVEWIEVWTLARTKHLTIR